MNEPQKKLSHIKEVRLKKSMYHYDFIYLESWKKKVKANGPHQDISCCHLRTLRFQTRLPTKKQ